MCGIHQRPDVTFARLLEVARYTFSFDTKLATAISDCTKRAETSGEGGEDRCRSSCGMLPSYEAAGGSSLETFVPHKLDILPEDVRYWTLLDVR